MCHTLTGEKIKSLKKVSLRELLESSNCVAKEYICTKENDTAEFI